MCRASLGQASEEAVDVAEGLGLEVVLAGIELGAQRVTTHDRAVVEREVELLAGVGLVVGLDPHRLVVGGVVLVEELLEPQLEVEHAPHRHRVDRVGALDPALEGVQHRTLVDVAAVGEGLGEEDAVDVVLQPHEPLALRRGRADLVAPTTHRLRHPTAHRVAQDALAPPLVDERLVGQREGEAHEVSVEEGQAHLQAEVAGVLVGVTQPRGEGAAEEVVEEAPAERAALHGIRLVGVLGSELRPEETAHRHVAAATDAVRHDRASAPGEHVERATELGGSPGRPRGTARPAQLAQVHEVVRPEAAESLVAAVPVEQGGRGCVTRRGLAHDAELGVGTGRDERLLLEAHEVAQVVLEVGRSRLHAVGLDPVAEGPDDVVDVAHLVGTRVGEEDRPRLLDALRRGRLGADETIDDRHDGSGVDAARERGRHRAGARRRTAAVSRWRKSSTTRTP